MPEQEAVQLFPKTSDTLLERRDWAQDSDEYRRREGDRRTDGIGMIVDNHSQENGSVVHSCS